MNGYKKVIDPVVKKYGSQYESIVVQIQQKYKEDEDWEELTVLLLNDGYYGNPKWVWENDWWEGQQFVELIAAAPVSKIKLSKEYAI